MDCCRTAIRLGGKQVGVYVRSPKVDMKASDWEVEEAEMENIPINENHVPKEFVIKKGKLAGVTFEKVRAEYKNGKRKLIPIGEPLVTIECDDRSEEHTSELQSRTNLVCRLLLEKKKTTTTTTTTAFQAITYLH